MQRNNTQIMGQSAATLHSCQMDLGARAGPDPGGSAVRGYYVWQTSVRDERETMEGDVRFLPAD